MLLIGPAKGFQKTPRFRLLQDKLQMSKLCQLHNKEKAAASYSFAQSRTSMKTPVNIENLTMRMQFYRAQKVLILPYVVLISGHQWEA